MRSLVWLFMMSVLVVVAFVPSAAAQTTLPQTVEFNRDIRPILSDNCFACHGPDENTREADFRLDHEADAFADRDGIRALVPGKPEESELYLRITSEKKSKRMPPASFGKQLSKYQIALVRRWIEQGAKWQKHWSLIPAKRPQLPATRQVQAGKNPIDPFILARLEREGLRPAGEADRRTLVRRLSFDLLGLPPTPEEVDAFIADQAPDAYEKLVERLLGSKHYGERMALYWLDAVRYADTDGYHGDNHRDIAHYRDYVIQSFNDNKPFDQFTMEQLAGDLMPNATLQHKIASGYNRLLMTTREGGAQPKEYMAKYAADRVRNVSSVWLGMTMGCAECHDHKFDPFTIKEFYRFASFFADIQETAVGEQQPFLLTSETQSAQLRRVDEQIAAAQKALNTQTPELEAAQAKWEESLRVPEVRKLRKDLIDTLLVEPAKRTAEQKQAVAAHYRTIAPLLEPTRKKLAGLQSQKKELTDAVPKTLVSMAVEPRVMRVLPRGNWLDDSGEIVAPGVPASLSPVLAAGGSAKTRATRLDLAKWMTAPDNPLVARVFVNRLWKLLFGQGLVKTLEDFGSQGAWPTHPELLDWLAVEFRESGWNVKHVVKLMVTSNTYRQSSKPPAQQLVWDRDPYNQLLARQARFRLDAEMIRDNALAISGLLMQKIGGPSVKPYQPAGYWSFLNFPKREWQKDQGDSLYRRGVYTYWCRTFLHPSMLAFDASTREECTVERPRSNTPLQALVLLNDPIYVEASRVFAERILREGGAGIEPRIQFAYRQALCRKASAEEVKLLSALYDKHLKQYQADQSAAHALLSTGDRPAAKDLNAAELAAWASVARVILNLHETITRD